MTSDENGVALLTATTNWIKSRASSPQGNCVEMARLPGGRVAIRNSRDPVGAVLVFNKDEVADFVHDLRSGVFDDFA